MAQPRIRAQRAQQRVLHDVFGVLVAGEPPRVREQLVAVGLDEVQNGGRRRSVTSVQRPAPPECEVR